MSRNLVNGDSLKKYHIGINTPNISKELINENVTSFKVGTSNVNGVDLTNQMEQSLVDITYIKGKTVKENSKLNSVKVVFDSGEKELHSLQDRFYDEYKDGKLHKMVKKITPKDFEVIHMHSGSEHSWNNNSGTYSFVFNFVGGDCIDESVLACSVLDVINYSDLTNGTRTGIFLSREWAWIGFRVDNDTIGVSNSDIDSQKLEKAKTWFFNSNIEIHYLINETITNESITILANPNEEINVVSGTPTTIKHIVQLNTKSQIEEAQRRITNNNKNIWQKFKEFTECDMSLNKTGYIKLPNAFGGLKLQWMELVSTMKSGTSRLVHSEFCPIAHSSFLHCVCSISKTSSGGYTEYHATITPGDNLKSFTVEVKRDGACASDVTVKTTVFMIGV